MMALKLRLARKTNSELDSYQGSDGELSYNQDEIDLHLHNGIREKGYRLLKEIIDKDVRLNGGEITDPYSVPLLSSKGLYCYVYSVSLDQNSQFPSQEVLKNAPAPSPEGNGKWNIVLGKNDLGDGFAGLYYADLGDTTSPSEETFWKIPIQGSSNNGHWIYSPISPANRQIRILSKLETMELADVSDGTVAFSSIEIGKEFVPTQLDFIIRSISGSITADSNLGFGLFDGTNNANVEFNLSDSNEITTFPQGEVLSYRFDRRRVYSSGQKPFIRVQEASSDSGSVEADVLLIGYTI